ncbi:hypothetical protein Tsubulata_218019 [Turnera subulata]|uniref:Fatty acyl-CoA reductase n=1 Tax=Turnera subulata TaxID=218843 RepID=A0A9Q0GCM1_9ROSI|nr:hypothetical protein Tsubulata_218019 [Turnera subulata]
MLRAVPNVGKLYVLIKAKDKAAAMDRLKKEIIDEDLFSCLKDRYGKSYYGFMKSKLVPVLGNVSEDNLGMDPDTMTRLAEEINVIIHSAALTIPEGRLEVSINTNTKGAVRALNFARKCKMLCLFLHVSTAYVVGNTDGVFFERALTTPPNISAPLVDVDAEIKLASELDKSLPDDNEKAKKMKALGVERANFYGWQNAYAFTKAMAEMQINRMRGNIPVVIVRPSFIESSYREPFPGWIQGNRMFEPIILSYGQGHLPCFVGEANTIMDIVPVDMVVNAILAAMAKHGISTKPELHVYNVTSSLVNPLPVRDFFEYCYFQFTRKPLLDSKGNKISLPNRIVSAYLTEKIVGKYGLQRKMSALNPEYTHQLMRSITLARLYRHPFCNKVRFDSGNTRKLLEDMSTEEKQNFGFDVGIIDWRHYLVDIHIPSIRRRILKEPTSRI